MELGYYAQNYAKGKESLIYSGRYGAGLVIVPTQRISATLTGTLNMIKMKQHGTGEEDR